MRKPDFCLCENKGADQLLLKSTKIRNFKLLTLFCACAGQFVSDLVGNPEDRFSRVAAQLVTTFHGPGLRL